MSQGSEPRCREWAPGREEGRPQTQLEQISKQAKDLDPSRKRKLKNKSGEHIIMTYIFFQEDGREPMYPSN